MRKHLNCFIPVFVCRESKDRFRWVWGTRVYRQYLQSLIQINRHCLQARKNLQTVSCFISMQNEIPANLPVGPCLRTICLSPWTSILARKLSRNDRTKTWKYYKMLANITRRLLTYRNQLMDLTFHLNFTPYTYIPDRHSSPCKMASISKR